jgi:hypothetical protein
VKTTPVKSTPVKTSPAWIALATAMLAAGCTPAMYVPDMAADPYPRHLHEPNAIDVQVFRNGTTIELVNATGRSYENVNVWINKRWVRHVASLPAGARLRLSLWDFFDERGERINAGGFWRVREPTPIRLVQLQIDDEQPLIGLVAIPGEPLEER